MLKNIKICLPLIVVISILALLFVSCRSAESYPPLEAVNPFDQIFGSSEQIRELDDDFIEAVISVTYGPKELYEPFEITENQNVEDVPEEPEEARTESFGTPEPAADSENEVITEAEASPAVDQTGHASASRNRVFGLTEHEKMLYQKYLSSMDISVLAGEPPITISKIFIKLAINEELEACYYLHAKTASLIPKDQYMEEGRELLSIMDMVTRRNFANREFGNIDYKEFIQLTEVTGYIEHRDIFGFTHRVNFIKNDNDVWLIEFFRF